MITSNNAKEEGADDDMKGIASQAEGKAGKAELSKKGHKSGKAVAAAQIKGEIGNVNRR